MKVDLSKVYFWMSLVISILALLVNIGLFIVVIGVMILPLIVAQIKIGLNWELLKENTWLLIFASSNFLVFNLIRPDGVHKINQNGLSALLSTIGISGTYVSEFTNAYFIIALITFGLQILICTILLIKIRRKKKLREQHCSGNESSQIRKESPKWTSIDIKPMLTRFFQLLHHPLQSLDLLAIDEVY